MNIKNESGQMLVEVLIALGLFVIIMSSVIIFFFNGQFSAINSGKIREALGVARNGIEASRFIRDDAWGNLVDGDHGLVFTGTQWQFSGTSDVTGEFTRKITISLVEDNVKQILSEVTWQDVRLGQQQVSLVTYLSDWKNAPPPGGDPGDPGGGGTTGDWTNPVTLGSLNIGAGSQATDIDVLNKMVYLSAEAGSSSKPDFFIIDATDGANPFVVSSIDTGDGLNAVDVSGDYAYAANQDDDNQLHIIDLSLSTPALITAFNIAAADEGITVFYLDDTVYVGTAKSSSGTEFHIIDVTDRNAPLFVGDLEIGDDVNGIFVKGDTAYLATGDSDELIIVNITDPANPSISSGFAAAGNSEDGKTAYLVGNKLYLGRLQGGKHTDHHEFHVIDVSDPLTPTNLGSIDLQADLSDLRVRNNLIFMATSDPNDEFQIWDISDPADMILFASFNFPQDATGIDYEDNIVYVSVRSNDALRIITSGP